MKWITSLKERTERFFNNKTTLVVVSSSYQTLSYLFKQVGVLPEAIGGAVTHTPTRKIASQMGRILLEDVAPLVLITYVSQQIQEHGQEYINEESNNSLSAQTLLELGLIFLQAATWLYKQRAATQLITRTTILTLSAAQALKETKKTAPITVCKEAECSSLRFLQGTVRDNVNYYATAGAISIVGFIPGIGQPLASILKLDLMGRYVTGIVLADACNRHQVVFLQEYPEIKLSLGIGHASITWLLSILIEKTTSIPRALSQDALDPLALIVLISIAFQLHMPALKQTSSRKIIDPIGTFQWIIGSNLDTWLLGLKVKIPRMLDASDSRQDIGTVVLAWPWAQKANEISRIFNMPLVRLLLPPALHNLGAIFEHPIFIERLFRDPIFRANWSAVQTKIIRTINIIDTIKYDPLVVAAGLLPEDTRAAAMSQALGLPKNVAKVVYALLTDTKIADKLLSLKYEIERLNVDTPLAISIDHNGLAQQPPLVLNQKPQEQEALTPTHQNSFAKGLTFFESEEEGSRSASDTASEADPDEDWVGLRLRRKKGL